MTKLEKMIFKILVSPVEVNTLSPIICLNPKTKSKEIAKEVKKLLKEVKGLMK